MFACLYILHRRKEYIFIYANLPRNAIVRLPDTWSGDCQGKEIFLTPFADKQTRNYGCSKQHPSELVLGNGITYMQIYQEMP